MACLKNGMEALELVVLITLMPVLKAFQASRDDVVACSKGVSNFWIVLRDSPSLFRISIDTFPSASSTWFWSLACASVLASVRPLSQLTALRVRRYWVPILAIEPSSTAALAVRWQTSRAIAGISFASAG